MEDTKLMMKEVDLREELTGRSEANKSNKYFQADTSVAGSKIEVEIKDLQ